MPISTGRLPSAMRPRLKRRQFLDHGDRARTARSSSSSCGHRDAERRHDGVADELVEHAALLGMQSTIRVKYSFSRLTMPCGPSSSDRVVKLRTSENRIVASTVWPPNSRPRRRPAAGRPAPDPYSATWSTSCAFRWRYPRSSPASPGSSPRPELSGMTVTLTERCSPVRAARAIWRRRRSSSLAAYLDRCHLSATQALSSPKNSAARLAHDVPGPRLENASAGGVAGGDLAVLAKVMTPLDMDSSMLSL